MNTSPSCDWWYPIRKGLTKDQDGKHYKKMGMAIWLYLHLHQCADRQTGQLTRRYRTIASEMGIPERTIQYWMGTLKTEGYVGVNRKQRCLSIQILNWRPIKKKGSRHAKACGSDMQGIADQNRGIDFVTTQKQTEKIASSAKDCMSNESPYNESKNHITHTGDFKDQKPAAKKPEKPTNPDIKLAVDFFHSEFVRVFGQKPHVNGKHAKVFQVLLEKDGRGIEEVKRLTTAFLTTEDSFVKSKGFPIELFPSQINKLLVAGTKQSERGFVF